MKQIWTDRRLFAGLTAMLLITFLASKSSITSDFYWALVSIVGIISGSNAWQWSQLAKYGKNSGVPSVQEKKPNK